MLHHLIYFVMFTADNGSKCNDIKKLILDEEWEDRVYNKMGFNKIKQNRAYEGVVEQLQESILNGQFVVGDYLPGERNLAETFGVSRGTIREALRVLEQKGLIEIRVGIKGGTIVKAATTKLMSDSLDILIRSKKIDLKHIGEFREGVEGLTAYLAAKRATKEDIKKLKILLSKARECYEAGTSHWNKMTEVGTQIHGSLAKITRNPIYIFVHQIIHDNISNYYASFLKKIDDDLYKENYLDLCNIVNAIAEGECEQARDFVLNHVGKFTKVMEEKANKSI